jgi:hypothetical protein
MSTNITHYSGKTPGNTLLKPFVAIIFLSWFLNQKHMPKMRKLYQFSADFIRRYKYFTPMEF